MDRESQSILRPTPIDSQIEFRPGDFGTLAEALDYSARGVAGFNFYGRKGELKDVLPYAELRSRALAQARRLLQLQLSRGDRVALVGETTADFVTLFFACQYSGLVPVPLPAPAGLGKRDFYIHQLRNLVKTAQPKVMISSAELVPTMQEAAGDLGLRFLGSAKSFNELDESTRPLVPATPEEAAYIQYTSGSTQMPRGVVVTQQAVLANLQAIILHGVKVTEQDRMVSWLPYYHDMGLVGLVLVPVAAQRSADYMATSTFALRPRVWLELMSRSRGTISFAPPFGYELVARRVGSLDVSQYDLSAWRVAGVGAEMIRAETLEHFAEVLKPARFDATAFLPCYGMAEHSLAITFSPLDEGVRCDVIDRDKLSRDKQAEPATTNASAKAFVDCGTALPGHELQVRDEKGEELPERHSGTIYVRGPSMMSGYFNEPELTNRHLSADGWFNTGDVGYRVGDRLVITGRSKDLIIVNGRNIWPQDLEYIAEQQSGIRTNDALAFELTTEHADEHTIVLIVQCRETDEARRAELIQNIRNSVRTEFATDCHVVLVAPHTLPRTSSGKLSRSRARLEFLESESWEQLRTSAA
ncbi:MAG: fatty acyl-AMP ligase [Chromatiales bacterium]|nr:MAG: fatty acyl-AMP ligase [Chromatiales bacterium]